MELTFTKIIDLIATNVFDGSTTLAGLAILLGIWAICAVLCLSMKAPPVYTIVPLIPLSLFFGAYGLLNTTVTIIIILVSSALVAAEFKKVVD